MSKVAIVPKGLEAWTQELPFRVDHLARDEGRIQSVYFEDSASAVEFASEHKGWGGAACVVESRNMVVTHEVRCEAPLVNYTFWVRRFGDLDTAKHEFERRKEDARQSGGRYVLTAAGATKPIEVFSKSVD